MKYVLRSVRKGNTKHMMKLNGYICEHKTHINRFNKLRISGQNIKKNYHYTCTACEGEGNETVKVHAKQGHAPVPQYKFHFDK